MGLQCICASTTNAGLFPPGAVFKQTPWAYHKVGAQAQPGLELELRPTNCTPVLFQPHGHAPQHAPQLRPTQESVTTDHGTHKEAGGQCSIQAENPAAFRGKAHGTGCQKHVAKLGTLIASSSLCAVTALSVSNMVIDGVDSGNLYRPCQVGHTTTLHHQLLMHSMTQNNRAWRPKVSPEPKAGA